MMTRTSIKIDPWLLCVLSTFTLLAWLGWSKVQQPIIDFGREIEIPARLLDGLLLYRDLEINYPPLAYYSNAFFLLIFGHRLEVFYVIGLGLALISTICIYKLAQNLTNKPWAALCTVYMLIYCILGPLYHNFIVPYNYGSVYGTTFYLLALVFLDQYQKRPTLKNILLIGFFCGCACLAKQEYGAAAIASMFIGINLSKFDNFKTRCLHSSLLVITTVICFTLPFSIIAKQSSWEVIYSSLVPLSKASVLSNNKLLDVSPIKTFSWWWHTLKLFICGISISLSSVIFVDYILKKFRLNAVFLYIIKLSTTILLTLVGVAIVSKLPIVKYYRSGALLQPLSDLSWLFITLLPLLAILILLKFKNKMPKQFQENLPLWIALIILSIILNARWLFHIDCYGLYAAPIAILFFAQIFQYFRKYQDIIWRSLLTCILIAGFIQVNNLSYYSYQVHSNYGNFFTKKKSLADVSNSIIDYIDKSKQSSVLIIPEGAIFNFMTGTQSSSPLLSLTPASLPTHQDEEEFVSILSSQPPDSIVSINMPFPLYGHSSYHDFIPHVSQWINERYRLTRSFEVTNEEETLGSRNVEFNILTHR
jgi:4-amino-4-deoxy-L-arabinose transferase-like glycosyltransferase